MRIPGVVWLAVLAGGCTTVRLEQREGCWVRQTTRWPNQLQEEMGPCEREKPAWSEDRLTRLVQECMVQADYRWRNQALAAWERGDSPPEPEPEASVLRFCMNEAAHSVVTENETLRKRLDEVTADRDALRASGEKDREHLHTNHDRLTDALGEAAKKPAGSAVATSLSSSEGTAMTRGDNDTSVVPPLMSVPAPEPARGRAPGKPAGESEPDRCEGQPGVPVRPAHSTGS